MKKAPAPECPRCGGEVQYTELTYGRLRDWDHYDVVSTQEMQWYCINEHPLLVDNDERTVEAPL